MRCQIATEMSVRTYTRGKYESTTNEHTTVDRRDSRTRVEPARFQIAIVCVQNFSAPNRGDISKPCKKETSRLLDPNHICTRVQRRSIVGRTLSLKHSIATEPFALDYPRVRLFVSLVLQTQGD